MDSEKTVSLSGKGVLIGKKLTRQKVAYVIGALRGGTSKIRKSNKDRAKHIAVELWKLGFAVICPHTNGGYLSGQVNEDVLMEGHLELLSRSDIVVVVSGRRTAESKGSKKEIQLCNKLGITIYEDIKDLVEDMNHEKV